MTNSTQNSAQNLVQNPNQILEKNLHARFTFYGKNSLKWKRKCTLLLPEIAKYRIWEKKGFFSIYEYAAKLAGMSHASVEAALWAMKKVEDKPELRRVIEEKGIEIIRPIANIATQETAKFWAEKAMEMSRNTLAAYAKEYKKSERSAPCAGSGICHKNSDLFSDLNLQIKPEIAEKLQKLKGQGSWDDLMEKFINLYEQKLEENKPQLQENAKEYIPAKIKNYVLAKTNNTCAFPDCMKPYEILHHTERFALTHEHDPDSLIPLCKAHERMAHAGLIENENQSPENWRIKTTADKTTEKWQKVDKWVTQCYTGKSAENCA
ncbi:MAG: hypothetical protein US89_C0005G0102 [Candidatus Peregrinibacteria bacterium GW2011_GWF2_38_29]|nr:MAG: hypothetical protein US89_C0005G0102 [Candidatus Peregrinibacteria bacterium GW2011_GWF2_38_29]HBB02689.1 hypothetical protein [Candidatus Peregrinibacteria bacterium]